MKSSKIWTVIQWIFAVFFLFGALAAFTTSGGAVSGILFLLLGVLVSPFRKNIFNLLPEQFRKKSIAIVSGIVLTIASFGALPSTDTAQEADQSATEISAEAIVSERSIITDNTIEEESSSAKSEQTIDTSKAEEEKLAKEKEEAEKKKAEEAAKKAEEKNLAKEKAELEAKAAETKAAAETKGESAPAEIATAPHVDEAPATNETKSGSGDGNAENFNTYNNPEQQKTEATYVLNTNSKKFHKPSCRHVKKISPEHYSTSSDSRDTLISQGYDPCGTCNP